MTTLPTNPDGFGSFFRTYTRSWVHTVATAGLTAFGTLTFINRWFAALAISSYLLPPIVLYARAAWTDGEGAEGATAEDDRSVREVPNTGSDEPDPEVEFEEESASASVGDTDASSDAPEPASAADPADGSSTEKGEPDSPDESSERGKDPDPESEPELAGWTPVETSTEVTLRDAAIGGRRAYAAGDGGVVLAGGAESASGGWEVVLADGPGAAGNDLRGIDATDDGEAVWVAGDGGAVGRIEAASGRHTDHSAPGGQTNNLAGIAVSGPAGGETVLAIDGSGGVLRGRWDGSETRWEEPVTPGSGSSLSGVSLSGETGHCCDTNDGVFETTDRGGSFEAIGPVGAAGTLVAVAQGSEPVVASDDGVVHRRAAENWTPERVADSLVALAASEMRALACTPTALFERGEGTTWERSDPVGVGGLRAVAVGEKRAVAVGENGTVVELIE